MWRLAVKGFGICTRSDIRPRPLCRNKNSMMCRAQKSLQDEMEVFQVYHFCQKECDSCDSQNTSCYHYSSADMEIEVARHSAINEHLEDHLMVLTRLRRSVQKVFMIRASFGSRAGNQRDCLGFWKDLFDIWKADVEIMTCYRVAEFTQYCKTYPRRSDISLVVSWERINGP